VAEEAADRTRHPKIFVGRFRPHDWTEVQTQLLALRTIAEEGDAAAVRAKFREIVPEYHPVLTGGPAPASQPVPEVDVRATQGRVAGAR
jgi:FlaA1/EpsC-like NDP-sugar epimerase